MLNSTIDPREAPEIIPLKRTHRTTIVWGALRCVIHYTIRYITNNLPDVCCSDAGYSEERASRAKLTEKKSRLTTMTRGILSANAIFAPLLHDIELIHLLDLRNSSFRVMKYVLRRIITFLWKVVTKKFQYKKQN